MNQINRRDILKITGLAIVSGAMPADLQASPVPGGWVTGHLTNKGKLLPKVTWACDGILMKLDDFNCFHIQIKKVWGEYHIDHLKNLKPGDTFMVGHRAFSDCRKLVGKTACIFPKIGDAVRITCEHYVTNFGADGLAYVGSKG